MQSLRIREHMRQPSCGCCRNKAMPDDGPPKSSCESCVGVVDGAASAATAAVRCIANARARLHVSIASARAHAHVKGINDCN